ncbi:MAG TPA: response regulator [Acidobacteriota bacterium]|nr:response regulator [Acidobacteriota bacterium]
MPEKLDILLVEDNPDDVELTLHALRRHNLANKIHVANDGEEALNFIRDKENQSPKVILLDLKLPKISGMEVLEELKKDPATQCIPVVILTSSKHDRDILKGYKLGVNSYIVKPIDFERFTDAVRHLGLYWILVNEPPDLEKRDSLEG